MILDPELQEIVNLMQTVDVPPIWQSGVSELRERLDVATPSSIAVHSIEDSVCPGPAGEIPIRIYRPAETSRGIVLFFHGGGWTIGNLDSHDGAARAIANATGCTLVAVHYRLAPEDPFPAAVEDAWAAVQWADGQREALTGNAAAPLIVMGDSAGGNLSAVVAIMARDANGPAIAMQVLVYPATIGDIDSPDMFSFEPPLLERSDIEWFYDQYIPREQRKDWRFAPAFAPDLTNLPPAVILTAEFDLMTSQSVAYGEMLAAKGNDVRYLTAAGGLHGFLSMLPEGRLATKAIAEIAAEVASVT